LFDEGEALSMKILMCTDGSRCAAEALRFGALIARKAKGPITLLGVVERPEGKRKVERMVERTSNALCEDVPDIETKIRHGHAAEEILKETEEREYDLVIAGSRGRRGITRFLLGSTAARLARYLQTSLLIVKGQRRELEKILVCTAGAKYGEKDTEMAGRIATLTGASVTILHVMSQLPLTPEAKIGDLENSTEDILASDAREGIHLRKDLQILDDLCVRGQAKVRHGLVVEEILAEIKEEDYDLVVIGAHIASGLQRFVLNNITEDILLSSDRPVLVVR
jgi:nucleotide-binding universal stress UspA family protein